MEQPGKDAGNITVEQAKLFLEEERKIRLNEAIKALDELKRKYSVDIDVVISYNPEEGFKKNLILIDKL